MTSAHLWAGAHPHAESTVAHEDDHVPGSRERQCDWRVRRCLRIWYPWRLGASSCLGALGDLGPFVLGCPWRLGASSCLRVLGDPGVGGVRIFGRAWRHRKVPHKKEWTTEAAHSDYLQIAYREASRIASSSCSSLQTPKSPSWRSRIETPPCSSSLSPITPM